MDEQHPLLCLARVHPVRNAGKNRLASWPQARMDQTSSFSFRGQATHRININMKWAEIKEDKDATLKIATMIQKCNFGEIDIENGTCGFCGTFALALHRQLKKQGIETELVVFCDEPKDASQPDQFYWSHFAIRYRGQYFDIRGPLNPEDAHEEFGTTIIRAISEATAIRLMRDAELRHRGELFTPGNPMAHSGKWYRDLKTRLTEQRDDLEKYWGRDTDEDWGIHYPDADEGDDPDREMGAAHLPCGGYAVTCTNWARMVKAKYVPAPR